ncbi:efflux RND transporter periplasmic adaptor subunit [Marinithermus hydrothermalis]|uniref:Efflux transporter, RND family, MFP subunit n=1 Tax=Marinithermus hydrothermalis (strain DSM 14884 / JCM 11576 / T1) TaxID=869210 RepID=F2NMA1_MARHT|nr:HlyD family efflux transporter periplasmic adaptor subunit [Marinithermus hydrothermalis]AEB11789.1 efflux transporter, RND family, MFP subunit [Marinithermus hydrothermalis DSM 14884]
MRKVVLFLPLLLIACAPKPKATASTLAVDAPETAREAPALVVRTVLAERGTLYREGQTQARIEPERESRVAAGVSGRVVQALDPGTRVEAGDAVVVLDEQPFQDALEAARLALKQAQANLERAEAQARENRPVLLAQLESARLALEAATKRYEEAKALYEAGTLARLDLLNLEAQWRQAEAAYKNAQEALNRLDRGDDLRLLRLQVEQAALQVRQAERNLREARIRAPFAGEVMELYVRVGEFAAAGQPAFRLGSLSLLAKAHLAPEEAALLTPDGSFELAQDGKRYPARLVRKTGLPGQNRLVEVVFAPEGALKPGTAELRYRMPLAEGVLLPAGALKVENGQAYVFVMAEGRAQKTAVVLLASQGGRVVVQGLPEGARVIYPVPESLQDGDKVEAL